MKSPFRSQVIAATLLGATLGGYHLLRDGRPANSRSAAVEATASGTCASMDMASREDSYGRRSEVDLPPQEGSRPLPDRALIALADNRPVPAAEPVGQKVARARSEGYHHSELSDGPLEGKLADLVGQVIRCGEDPALMRGFERTLKARARVGFDSSTIDSLLSFLRVSPDGLPPSAYHSIANDIIRLIVSDIKLAPETVTSLVAIVDDASCDALVRDYVVQHLEEVYRLAKFHLIVEKQLIRWMESGSESVPGAAMLIVERSWREGRYTGDASLIGQAISRQLSSDNLECRIAALSLGVALRDANVAVPARTIAADLHASPALRAAAIHALGVLGDPHSDPALLAAQLSRPGGSFLQLAVTSATASLTATR